MPRGSVAPFISPVGVADNSDVSVVNVIEAYHSQKDDVTDGDYMKPLPEDLLKQIYQKGYSALQKSVDSPLPKNLRSKNLRMIESV